MPLYAEAQVGLVTPLRDGMNLVAKEYVAAQDPEDPGVLVLSQFAGAARELERRWWSIRTTRPGWPPRSIARWRWSKRERCERHAAMLGVMRRNSLDAWRDRFEADLRGSVDQRCMVAPKACCDPPETVVSPTPPSYNPKQ